jgi:hypothetical protein
MQNWSITDAKIFFGVAAAIVAYILYMIIRRRKGERGGLRKREVEL